MTTKKGDRVVMVVAILVIAASWATIGVKAAITAKAPAKKIIKTAIIDSDAGRTKSNPKQGSCRVENGDCVGECPKGKMRLSCKAGYTTTKDKYGREIEVITSCDCPPGVVEIDSSSPNDITNKINIKKPNQNQK